MSRYALEGVHVLDFAWVGVGPITTKYLADNGAEVIRVESAAHPDILRFAPPWKDAQPGINNSQFFASFNSSKRGITLDLSQTAATSGGTLTPQQVANGVTVSLIGQFQNVLDTAGNDWIKGDSVANVLGGVLARPDTFGKGCL